MSSKVGIWRKANLSTTVLGALGSICFMSFRCVANTETNQSSLESIVIAEPIVITEALSPRSMFEERDYQANSTPLAEPKTTEVVDSNQAEAINVPVPKSAPVSQSAPISDSEPTSTREEKHSNFPYHRRGIEIHPMQ